MPITKYVKDKVVIMSVYRVKQFIWAAKSLLQDVDTTYVNNFLNSDEKKLFNKLKKPDKHHCIRVCKDAIDISKEKNMNVNRVAKAALLHDIGKSEYSLNLFEKSAVVILNKLTKGKLKKYDSFKVVDAYYNHSEKGANILKKLNVYDKEFLDTIRYHHNNKITNESKLLQVIRECDNKN